MKALAVVASLVLFSGCASQSYMQSPEWQAIYQQSQTAQAQNQFRSFQQSTIEAERNTVARVNALEARVCDLERQVYGSKKTKHQAVDTSEYDRRFQKYMAK